ncbi:uncharacterized protein ACA1_174300 [Acanthamoeba castellanii str. Neff]|uniref:Uncharacterized protein n=1 Tax=Acanthamoeba castellanii (strain ATCC 30010 / Neff) TaxID=1257118 RepID=L8HHV5_ACACF|nr:uncharacterized protein ACA1_174300 [Acanthamoeba castellanii str. Neff]ELR24770.1 hypothetical protein ACA1_174300 [Acanthamoeba castellanii str. Neff]
MVCGGNVYDALLVQHDPNCSPMECNCFYKQCIEAECGVSFNPRSLGPDGSTTVFLSHYANSKCGGNFTHAEVYHTELCQHDLAQLRSFKFTCVGGKVMQTDYSDYNCMEPLSNKTGVVRECYADGKGGSFAYRCLAGWSGAL